MGDCPHVQTQRIARIDMVIQHRRQQVVRRAERVHVASEVQVNVFHRQHLRVAAARRAALHAEDRPKRRLANGRNRLFAELIQAFRQPDSHRCLAFACRGRRDSRHHDQLAARRIRRGQKPLQSGQADFGLVAPVHL